MGVRHDLEAKQVINEYAKITVEHEEYNGKKTTEVREIIIQKLKDTGLLEKEEEIEQNISVSQRTGATIEPLPKLQWFVHVNKKLPTHNDKTLKELMLEPVLNKEIDIIPEHFEKIYDNWLGNLRDWCISRQRNWGVPIALFVHKITIH